MAITKLTPLLVAGLLLSCGSGSGGSSSAIRVCYSDVGSAAPLGESGALWIYSDAGGGAWGQRNASGLAVAAMPIALGPATLTVERRGPCEGRPRYQRRFKPDDPSKFVITFEPSSLARATGVRLGPEDKLLVDFEGLSAGDGFVRVQGSFEGAAVEDRRALRLRAFDDVGIGPPDVYALGSSPVVRNGAWPARVWPTSSDGEGIASPAPQLPWTRPDGMLEVIAFGPANGIDTAVRWPVAGTVLARIGEFKEGTTIAPTSVEVIAEASIATVNVAETSIPPKLQGSKLACSPGEGIGLTISLTDDVGRSVSGGGSLLVSSNPAAVTAGVGLTQDVYVTCRAPGSATVALPPLGLTPSFKLDVTVQ